MGRQYRVLSNTQAFVGGALISRQSIPNYAEVTLTNAQMLALRATPIALVAAPGKTSTFREFLSALLVVNVTTTAYTVGTNDMVIRQTGTTGVILSDTIEAVGFLDQVAIKANRARAKLDPIGFLLNKSLVLHNSGASEFTGGNAANTLKVRIYYRDINLSGYGTLA
jgi:hypothetical protein